MINTYNYIRIAYFQWVLFLFRACIAFQQITGPCLGQQLSTENGIRIVHNDQLIMQGSSTIHLAFVRKYGGIDAGDDDFMLFEPRSLVLDRAGNLYILDSQDPFIKKFDRNGAFIGSFGKKGEGPGEFFGPAGLAINNDGNLLIMDYRLHNVTALSPQGGYLHRTILEKDEGCWPDFYPLRDGNFLGGTGMGLRWAGKGEKYSEPVMKIVDRRGYLIKGFGEPKQYADPTMVKTANAVFFLLDKKENIWVSFRYQNRIEKYSH